MSEDLKQRRLAIKDFVRHIKCLCCNWLQGNVALCGKVLLQNASLGDIRLRRYLDTQQLIDW